MNSFWDWPGWGKASAMIGAVVIVAAGISSLGVLEPYIPATHAYARALVEAAQIADSASQKQINDSLVSNTVGILDLKLVALDGQLDSLNNQLNMIRLRLADPQGADLDLLRTLQGTIQKQIDEKTKERDLAACMKNKVQFAQAPSVC